MRRTPLDFASSASAAYGDQVEVISGIKDGTRLVTTSSPELTNGSAVEPEK